MGAQSVTRSRVVQPWTAVIFHVDMDAFYASVEVRDDPSLRGKPVLVGGEGNRGVVCAASYEARTFGCRSAQPMAVAVRRCPAAVVVRPRFEVYAAASARVFEVFDRYSPVVEGLSIDEAFLDMSGSERLLGPARQAAEALRQEVFEATGGLTCSVGISAIKFISKIASAMNKPDGLTQVDVGAELEFLAPLPIGKLWGVGPKMQEKLAELGVATVGDLRRFEQAALIHRFGDHGAHLHALAHARDPRGVETGRERKSISHEDTFHQDVVGMEALRTKLLSQATRVADRLVRKRVVGSRVQLKIRDTDFKTQTRQCMLPTPTDRAKVIYDAACRLLDAVDTDRRRFRLTGVGVGHLQPQSAREPKQLDLLAPAEDPSDAKGAQLQAVLTAVRGRFGHEALYPAAVGRDARAGGTGAASKTLDDE